MRSSVVCDICRVGHFVVSKPYCKAECSVYSIYLYITHVYICIPYASIIIIYYLNLVERQVLLVA